MFRSKKVQFLFVTDLAARGIDIPLLENVIHFDFPTKMKLFIHRAGRTARAGQSGTSYSIITPEELAYLHDLSIFVGRKYFDKPEEENNEDSRADLLSNPSKICFGKLPQSLIDEYQEYLGRVKEKNETTLEGL
mmetsp:Transcript_10325/g.14213  ORF Transcript_10325/g.14213 Transcript_10325/m.14213 type:complete len:134 (-) Transcript_10325:1333-1734(-)